MCGSLKSKLRKPFVGSICLIHAFDARGLVGRIGIVRKELADVRSVYVVLPAVLYRVICVLLSFEGNTPTGDYPLLSDLGRSRQELFPAFALA